MQKAQKEKAQEKEKRRCACGRETRDFLKKVAQKLLARGAVRTHC
jgi:hypothetical protein